MAKKKTTKGKKQKAAKKEMSELDKVMAQIPDEAKEKLSKIKGSLEKFKDKTLAQLEGYVMGLSLLPPSDKKEDKDKINVLALIDDNDSKKMPKHELHEKVQKKLDTIAEGVDKKLSPQVILISELWQQCYDQKTEVLQMIAMSAPVYDGGMLAAIKIAEVHKTMVLKKFEKYIVSYVLGGSLVQGKATSQSDIDVFVIIDDTDVKKMTRVELRDKLRAIIVGMGAEAGQMTGIQNKINIQTYILTDFWDSVKDANPVIFTFLRDGVPFYDRGVFMPWKQLLQMGRIKPSPEAIDMFMSSGGQFMERINMKLRDIVMEDLFWALLTPSQAALMMYGIPPTTPKETPEAMRNLLVKKEKLIEGSYVKILESVLNIRKDFEHGTRRSVTGVEVDKFLQNAKKYLDRLEVLFKEIEQRKQEEQVLSVYESTMTIIGDAFRLEGQVDYDDKKISALFDSLLVKKGHLPEKYNRMLTELFVAKKDYDANKLTRQEVNNVLKDSKTLLNGLVDHIQRKRGREIERVRVKIKYGEKFGEVILLGSQAYIVKDLESQNREVIKATITKKGNIASEKESSLEELENALMAIEIPPKVFIKGTLFNDLKTMFGEDVEVLVNY